jgi:hypothetical protein
MENLRSTTGFAELVAVAPALQAFTVLDIGCSSGIDPAWRLFGPRLIAFGFDPNIGECERLAAAEALPGVVYIPAFVGVPDDLPYKRDRAGRGPWSRNPMDRVSAMRSLELLKHQPALSEREKTKANLWHETRLADPDAPVILRDFLPARGVSDVDVIKIDIDGPDLGVLQSIADQLAERQVLAVGLEVNYFGSDDASDHSFHAMDRLMRACGFDLFDLSVRRYSQTALPAPYTTGMPGPTTFGRPVQGDALYLRDPNAPEPPQNLPPIKLLKLAAIASLAGQPDLAAEILLIHRTKLDDLIDVPHSLDLLAAQAQPGVAVPLGYSDYIAAFERGDSMFIHGAHPAQPAQPEPPAENDEVDQWRDLVSAMEKSTSWRLTAPLRWLRRQLPGG